MSSALNNAIVSPVDMSYTPPQVVTICSIYPGKLLPVKRPLFNKNFIVPTGSPDKPQYLTVEDCFQRVYHGEQFGERLTRELAERVANDIVNEVTAMLSDSDAQEDAFPGIFVCKQEGPDGQTIFTDRASPKELEYNAQRQTRYLKRKVATARELHRLKLEHRIDENNRIAARTLGIRGEEWQGDFESEANVPCPWCRRHIPSDAKKCAHCGEWVKPEYAPTAAVQQGQQAPQPQTIGGAGTPSLGLQQLPRPANTDDPIDLRAFNRK